MCKYFVNNITNIFIIISITYILAIRVLSVTLELHSPTILFVIIYGNEPLSQLSLLAVIFRQFKTIFIWEKMTSSK